MVMQFQSSDYLHYVGLTIKTSATTSRSVSYNRAEVFLFKAEQQKAYFSSEPKINGCALLEYKIKITRYINCED